MAPGEPMQEPMQEPMVGNETKSESGEILPLQEKTVVTESNHEAFQQPIHLLKPSSDHRSLVCDPVAMRCLAEMGPVSVLSVVGNQRGGKSTLMNLLHSRRVSGFQTGHYMDPQTTGLWVWPRPHPRCPGLTILHVDSEGLDSPHVPQHYNWLISATTLLMSDVFMYQTRGSIEHSSAERLDMILKVAEQLGKAGRDSVDADGNAGKGTGVDLAKCFFIWLLRDHQLQMKRSPKDELTEKLDPAQVRTLRRGFVDYDCVPLPRPASDDVLKQLDKHTFQDLSQEFREEFVVFERQLLDMLGKPRELLGSALTGATLGDLLKQYVSAMDQQRGMLGDICQMPTQRDMIRELAGKRAIDAGVRRYEECLQEAGLRGDQAGLPVPPAAIMKGHSIAEKAAFEVLEIEMSKANLEVDESVCFRQRLDARLAVWSNTERLVQGAAFLTASDGPMHAMHVVATDIDSADNSLMNVCQWPTHAPTLSRGSELRGGILWEIWQANAQHSVVDYHRLLRRFSAVGAETLSCHVAVLSTENDKQQQNQPEQSLRQSQDGQNQRNQCDRPGAVAVTAKEAVGVLYDTFQRLLDEAANDASFGPWMAAPLSLGTSTQSSILWGAARQGDEMVIELQQLSLDRGLQCLRDELADQRTLLLKTVETSAAELAGAVSDAHGAFNSGLGKVESRLTNSEAEFRHEIAESEARGVARSLELAKQHVADGLRGTQDAVRRALQALETSTSKTASEQQSALVAQGERSAELTSQVVQLSRDSETRTREAARDLRAEIEAAETRSRENATELRRAVEASEQRSTSSMRTVEASLRDHAQRLIEVSEGRIMEALKVSERSTLERLQSSVEALGERTDFALRDIGSRISELDAVCQRCESDWLVQLKESSNAHMAKVDELEARLVHDIAGLSAARHKDIERQQALEEDADRCGVMERRMAQVCEQIAAAHAEASRAAALAEEGDNRFEKVMETLRETEAQCRAAVEQDCSRTLGVVRQALTVVETEMMAERLSPLEGRMRDMNASLHRLLEDMVPKRDMNAVWESFAQLASQVTNVEEAVEKLKGPTERQ
eukprot:TRINITY_DN23973_c0_g1_i2.p1 TRINITY_DN23973_c0_g1~~TRINITY_DN23973_c0_g1_i2.p1  ORF type:complete len:1068 (-),score=187.94 TRINITY_DN23973_c0_g1_i2:124-3327(-)